MIRHLPLALLLFTLAEPPLFASDSIRPETEDSDQTAPSQETEAAGIIPEGGVTFSTQPLTPISVLPQKDVYDKALEELTIAQGLWDKGRAEAASDVALQAYDDLMSVNVRRRNKAKRKKLLSDRHRTATLYIDSSLAYIRDFVKKAGGSPQASVQGRMRMEDLRDVAVNYGELNRKLTKALEQYAVALSSPTVR